MAIELIVCGLGNPGPEYQETRHNMGFWVADLLCERFGGRWRRKSDRYLECRIEIARRPVSLIEPLTYMNRSGKAIESLADRDGFSPSELLVVCDDTALPLGRLRLRKKGRDGGHNGLRSIIDALGTRDFPRLRLGVGAAPETEDHADYVLSRFSNQDVESAREMVLRAAECVEAYVIDGADAAMSRFNAEVDPDEETD